MKSVLIVVVVAIAAVNTYASPVYVVPVELVDAVRVARSPGVARQAAPALTDLLADNSERVQRQAHDHHDVVDFGAHTGHHGAFGWFADFPVHSHD